MPPATPLEAHRGHVEHLAQLLRALFGQPTPPSSAARLIGPGIQVDAGDPYVNVSQRPARHVVDQVSHDGRADTRSGHQTLVERAVPSIATQAPQRAFQLG